MPAGQLGLKADATFLIDVPHRNIIDIAIFVAIGRATPSPKCLPSCCTNNIRLNDNHDQHTIH